MALNVAFSDVESKRFVAEVGTDVAPGTPLILGGSPVVTITGSGDYDGNALTLTGPNGLSEVLVGGRGGVGLVDDQATVSPTGAYYFDVTGATASTITPGATPVYLTGAGGLTITSAGNTRFGIALFFRGELSATDTAVQIGV